MITSLFISDAHVEPGQDLSRFAALGKMIVDRQPDNIYDLGDFASMSAISHWDMSKKLRMEGKRYVQDVAVAREAYELMFTPLQELQERQRNNKQRIYKPHAEKINGNHEDWFNKYIEQNPELEGAININRDFEIDAGWPFVEIHPYRSRVVRHGLNIMHCPLAGNNQPISGITIPYKSTQRFNSHVVFGHYHRSETASLKRTDAERTHRAISCPAFFEGTPHYLSPNAPAIIDRGVILIHQNEETLWPEIEEISIDRLKNEYGV